MIDVHGSLMVGVAIQIAKYQARMKNYTGELGILSIKEASEFITSYKFL